MQKVYLSSGNAWPVCSSRWGNFKREFSKRQDDSNDKENKDSQECDIANRYRYVDLSKFKVIRSKVKKKKGKGKNQIKQKALY